MAEIKQAKRSNWDDIWPIVHEAFVSGTTYAFDPDISKEDAYEVWMVIPRATYMAIENGEILGTYYIKPNQPALGSHVCNAGFIVNSKSRGKGIGRNMCEHALVEAVKLGFKAMQFNLVISTNKSAIKLWQRMGFEIIGTLPKAFNCKEKGLVDAHVMYKLLTN